MMETIGNNIVKPFGCTPESKKQRRARSDSLRQLSQHAGVKRTAKRGAGWRKDDA